MAYTYSKTNWQNGEHFSPVRDGTRIRDNLIALYQKSLEVVAPYTETAIYDIDWFVMNFPEYSHYVSGSPITETMRYASYYTPQQLNQMETAIQNIADHTFRPPNFYTGRLYSGNTLLPTEIDINNIEGAIETLWNIVNNYTTGLNKMPTHFATEWRDFA